MLYSICNLFFCFYVNFMEISFLGIFFGLILIYLIKNIYMISIGDVFIMS